MKQPPFATESVGVMLDRVYLMRDGGITRDPEEGREFAYDHLALSLYHKGIADGRIPKGYVAVGCRHV